MRPRGQTMTGSEGGALLYPLMYRFLILYRLVKLFTGSHVKREAYRSN